VKSRFMSRFALLVVVVIVAVFVGFAVLLSMFGILVWIVGV